MKELDGDGAAGRRLAVSIVNYGVADLVVAAMPALMRELARLAAYHVMIVDNCSLGGDGERLERGIAALGLGPSVEVIRSPVNGGFAAGNNIAFAAIRRLPWRPDAILLLNPDAEATPGAIDAMFAALDVEPKAGFVGPRLLNPDGTTWVGAFPFPTLWSEVAKGLGVPALQRLFPSVVPASETPIRVDWVTGSAAMIRWEAFEDLGDMDDGYFLYFDEVDYMLQGRRLGWESWHAPAALIRHEAGASTGVQDGRPKRGRQPDYWFQSWARYFSKNHGPLYARAAAAAKLAAMIVGHVQRRARGRPVAVAEGFYLDFLTKVALARLSPPPASDRAAAPGGRPPVRAR